MNFSIDLNSVLTTVVGVLCAYGVKGISSINRQLTMLNNRVSKIETWKGEHEKFQERDIGELKQYVKETRARLHEMDKGE